MKKKSARLRAREEALQRVICCMHISHFSFISFRFLSFISYILILGMPLFQNGKRVRSNRTQTKPIVMASWLWQLVGQFIDDLKTLLAIRVLMRCTRSIKANVFASFPIGAYSYAQFLKMNPDIRATSTIYIDRNNQTHCGPCLSLNDRIKNICNFFILDLFKADGTPPCRMVEFRRASLKEIHYFGRNVASVDATFESDGMNVQLRIVSLPEEQTTLDVNMECELVHNYGFESFEFHFMHSHSKVAIECCRDQNLNLSVDKTSHGVRVTDWYLSFKEMIHPEIDRVEDLYLDTNAQKIRLCGFGQIAFMLVHLKNSNDLEDLQLIDTGILNISHMNNLRSLGQSNPEFTEKEAYSLPQQELRRYLCI